MAGGRTRKKKGEDEGTPPNKKNKGKDSGSPGAGEFGLVLSPSNKNSSRDCRIKVAQVPSKAGLVAMILENVDPTQPNGPYPQHLWFLAIRAKKPWVMNLGFSTNVLRYHRNNRPVMTLNNLYKFNVYYIETTNESLLQRDNLVRLARAVADNLNDINDNRSTVQVEEDNFWMCPPGNTVISDFLSHDDAFDMLKRRTTYNIDTTYYETYMAEVHAYFRPGNFTLQFAREIHAPLSEVPEHLRQEEEQDDDDDENDVEVPAGDDSEQSEEE